MRQGGRTNRGRVWRPFFVQERKFWEGCHMKFSSLKKVLAVGLAAVVVVGALAGCGDNKAGAQKKYRWHGRHVLSDWRCYGRNFE